MVVLAIIAIVAAILLPTFVSARRESYLARSTVEGRQIAIALMQYRESNGAWPLDSLDPLVTEGHLSAPQMLLVPGDPYPGGFGESIAMCRRPGRAEAEFPNSFSTLYHGGTMEAFWTELAKRDPQAGILVLGVFANPNLTIKPCETRALDLSGRILRYNQDGSVVRRNFPTRTSEEGPVYCWSEMFSDVTDPGCDDMGK
jgi:hypothetical protein